MTQTLLPKLLSILAVAAAAITPLALRADSVETADGSKLQGKILKVDAGVVEIETTFAGVVKVKQSAVVALATESPVYLRTQAGNTILGTVSTAAGSLRVTGGNATGGATVANLEAAWLSPDQSPEARAAAAARRHWAYDASIDVLGKSGNSNSLATSLGFSATLASPEDKLVFYANYARATQEVTVGTPPVTQNKTSVNQSKAGVDYAANFSPDLAWYVREEIGTDKIQSLRFYSTTAAGLGMKWINTKPQQLTFRAGLAYRYESYDTGSNVSSPALDLALIHAYAATTWRLGNALTFLPSIEEFSNYRLLHDSFFETPLSASQWKVRLGVSNDFNSKPRPGKEKLDTTYYTKFLLSWK